MTDKQKHLEFIQNAITRMAGNSFRLKVWTVLLVSALFAFFASFGETGYVFIMIVPIAAFWILDGFLLSQECLFRSLYTGYGTKMNRKLATPWTPGNSEANRETAGTTPRYRALCWCSAAYCPV
jgi:hypothetical protein